MSESSTDRPEARLQNAVLWRRLDQPSMEVCRLWRHAESFRLEGTVLGATEGIPVEVRYEVLCGPDWETQEARVVFARGTSTRTVELRRDDDDQWLSDGASLDELNGIKDVDLGFTPATNTLPIRRLSLEVGATAIVDAAWVKFPNLSIELLPQHYTRLDAFRYRYESAGGAFVAELEVDRFGMVVQYGEWWRRVAEARGGAVGRMKRSRGRG